MSVDGDGTCKSVSKHTNEYNVCCFFSAYFIFKGSFPVLERSWVFLQIRKAVEHSGCIFLTVKEEEDDLEGGKTIKNSRT